MGAVEPDPQRMREFVEAEDAGPLVMINLLRYRERAAYPDGPADGLPDGFDASPCSGAEAYGRYSAAVAPLLAAVGGRPLFVGLCGASLIAPEGECWDHAILVSYPSRRAFLEMVGKPEYQAIAPHRTAALADSRLIATAGTVLPEPAPA